MVDKRGINHMDDRIRNYLDYVFSRTDRKDYLSFLNRPYSSEGIIFRRELHMCDTVIWMQIVDPSADVL